jgi:hypothetical protein
MIPAGLAMIVVWLDTQPQKFQKIVFTLLPAREKKLRSLHLQPTVYRN